MSKSRKKSKKNSKSYTKPVAKVNRLKNVLRKIEEFSSGIQKDAHGFKDRGDNILEQLRTDPLLRAAIEVKYSTIISTGYYFTGNVTPQKLNKLKSLRFARWHGQEWWQVLMYKNCFTELCKDSNDTVKELAIVKTDQMEIVNTDTGNVKKYLQIVSNTDSSKDVINFDEDRIVHFAFNNLGNSLWGESEIPVLSNILYSKALAEGFLSWLLESNQFRAVIKVPDGIGDEEIDNYLRMLQGGMIDRTNFLVIQGDEAEIKQLREISGFGELIGYIDHLRMEAMAVLQVPPLLLGITDNSNRSSSEYQIRYSFYTHIRSLLKQNEDEINNELLPALGISDMKLKYNRIDDQSKKDLLEIAQKLASVGADNRKLNTWLIDNGLDIPDDMLQNEDPESQMGTGLKLDKNDNQQPSRQATKMNFAGGSTTK